MNVIYVGKFVSDAVRQSRGIPPNPACSNRMSRLALAMTAAGYSVRILAQGNSLCFSRHSGFWHRPASESLSGIKISYMPTIGISYLSGLWNLLFFPFWVVLFAIREHPREVVFYNFYPSYIPAAVLLRLIGKRVTLDLEDVSVVATSVIPLRTIRENVEQLIGYTSMKALARICSFYITPSDNFLIHVPKRPALIIGGCMDVPSSFEWEESGTINILFSGKLIPEHGLNLVLDLIKALEASDLRGKYRVFICGRGLPQHIVDSLRQYRAVCEHKGYLDESEFRKLLRSIHIALVLQDPSGINALHKIPSKGYEYLGMGKAVVVSSIGEFHNLPESVLIKLREYSAVSLYNAVTRRNLVDLRAIAYAGWMFARENYTLSVQGYKIRKLWES